MKSWLLLLSFILLCSAHQSAHSAAKKNADYAAYFDGILRAEHKLANDDLSAALEEYSSVFRQFDFVFARDAYNALQLAILAKQHARRDSMLLLCAKSGVPEQVLRRNVLIQAAYAYDDKLFRMLLSKGTVIYMRRIDTVLRAEMQQRYRLEQDSKTQGNFQEICTDNFNRILELCKQDRFPGEQRIGINNTLGYGAFLPTLLHYPYSYIQLYDYLWAALHNGQVQPLSLIYLYGFNQTRSCILYTNRIPVDTQHFKIRYNVGFGLESTDQNGVDSARKKVWLRPKSEREMIVVVAKKHGIDFREGW